MNKTDRELAVELAVAIIQSWNGAEHTNAIQPSDAIRIANDCYSAVKGWS